MVKVAEGSRDGVAGLSVRNSYVGKVLGVDEDPLGEEGVVTELDETLFDNN